MNRFHALLAVPLLWGALFLVLDGMLFGTPGYATFMRSEIELAKVLAVAGGWAAALAFARGDYQRRAWFFVGGCMALALIRDLVTLTPLSRGLDRATVNLIAAVLIAVANVSQVVGTWMLARTWKVAQLALPGTRSAQWLTVGVVGLLAAAFAGPSLIRSGGRLLAGDASQAAGVFSALGDMVSLWLIAPLLLTALALRGGVFGWPFAFLAASYTAWLGYDAVGVLGPELGLGPRWTRTITELFRALGCLFGFSAGLAQRGVVRSLRTLRAPEEPALAGVA
jgi:hypothetical protein